MYITHLFYKAKIILVFVATVFLLLMMFQLLSTQRAHAAYQDGRLIDNNLFLDAQSMSASHIQSFLESKTGQLKNKSFKLDCDAPGIGTTSKQLYLNAGAPCGSTIPASQIIYYAAQIYGISPKVILATLQKEQSLITNPYPGNWEFNQAMGYNCPTSGHCDDNSGFFFQIDNGTWVLRYHFERARGNNNWWNSGGWTCGTEKLGPPPFYSPNLYPGQNVKFYDPYSGVQYKTVYIENAATSAMYCYTPHVFNNHSNSPHPQESKNPRCYSMHPASGDRGRCYTGSYNFVLYYELWFGPSVGPAYKAQVISHSSYPAIVQGYSQAGYAQFKNVGNMPWYDNVSAWSAGQKPVKLGTDIPLNRSSHLSAKWPAPHRMAETFGKVMNADGSLAENQHIVEPGQIAEFWFTFSVPHNLQPGSYIEGFRPIVEGQGPMNDTGTFIKVTVQEAQYKAAFAGQSAYPKLVQGQYANAYLMYKNVGNVNWYDEVSARSAGQKPVHLATDNPLNRSSKFSVHWPHPHRAATTFGAVYESNGTTLSTNQHIVKPGQIVRFDFMIQSSLTQDNGFFAESLRPVVQGIGPMNDVGTWLGVSIYRAAYQASFAGQSAFPSVPIGGSAEVYIRYKNTGNIEWYDEASAWNRKVLPVKLGTDSPLNRSSKFSSTWHRPNRPTAYFHKVYKADGKTLSSNQHVAFPGEIVEFRFTVSAPASQQQGFYAESFRPIIEGLRPMNNTGTWLGVTVTRS